jgi:hypothetical protein
MLVFWSWQAKFDRVRPTYSTTTTTTAAALKTTQK